MLNAPMHDEMRRLYAACATLGAEGPTQVARLLGSDVSTQTVKNWEKRGISDGGKNLLATKLGMNIRHIETGVDPVFYERKQSTNPSSTVIAIAPKISNVEPGPDLRGKVPLISWVQAGDWCHAADPHLPGEADRWLDCPVSHSANTFALRVRGDSMTAPHGRTYPEGCIVFVDPQQRNPNNGDRVVACLAGTDEVTFKVYKNEDGRQWLQPLNPMHEPIRSAFHIIGRVLGKWEDD